MLAPGSAVSIFQCSVSSSLSRVSELVVAMCRPITLSLALLAAVGLCEARQHRRSPSTITFPEVDQSRFAHLEASFEWIGERSPSSRTGSSGRWRQQSTPGQSPGSAPPPPPPSVDVKPRRPSSSIIFPDSNAVAEQEPEFVPECNNVTFAAYDTNTGFCEQLMMQSGCGAGEWFVLDRDSRQALCRPRPCPAKRALFKGVCVALSDRSMCGEGMALLVNELGEAECDCMAGAIYWPPTERCYPAMMRGPCLRHQMLKVNENGTAVCANNRCGRDGEVEWPLTGQCYPLRDSEHAPCPGGRMDVDRITLSLQCVALTANTVFDTPAFRCSRGSRRFQGNRCKRQVVSGPGLSGPVDHRNLQTCPVGFRLDRVTGACRRSRPNISFGGLG